MSHYLSLRGYKSALDSRHNEVVIGACRRHGSPTFRDQWADSGPPLDKVVTQGDSGLQSHRVFGPQLHARFRVAETSTPALETGGLLSAADLGPLVSDPPAALSGTSRPRPIPVGSHDRLGCLVHATGRLL
jgi:hypothetical protein